ncbi:uncharacterized protein BX664DRAFT_321291 [Halteromyces radiatus]|uniref:uncharacterized protein n=1 Tax=Halteromyces radiatus TaxID=101107 RepID=UPI00222077CA|nr:uncharacterized protein BX664DRAFT_321291 [Halteromyces radiatus]KAI8099460.1 hypothetical protein BX664DRAFT_321291 [Halteromyces radiatus]
MTVTTMELQGRLFMYHQGMRLTAFESGPVNSRKSVIMVVGLTDGYGGVPYLGVLNDALTKQDYSLIQIQTTSSYNGYGASSLENDVKELDYLIEFLKQTYHKTHLVVMGHSTGCQISVCHNKSGKYRQDIAGYILQAPVSDREWYSAVVPNHLQHIQLATTMREQSHGNEWMPRYLDNALQAIDVPITADRFYSLYARGGDDDLFSTDLTDEELKKVFQGVHQPMLLLNGAQDEFYQSSIDPLTFLERLQKLCPAIRDIGIIPGANHKVDDLNAQHILASRVLSFLDTICL